MRFVSTGPERSEADFRTALFQGLAPDGGLYQPVLPRPLDSRRLRDRVAGSGFPALAAEVARHLLGDEVPAAVLEAVVEEALDFPVPLRDLGDGVHVLELFHGPTLAFKDLGARFMARAMRHLDLEPDRARTVLVATSGDTGSAVAHAFHGMAGFRVVVLFPRDGVSPAQRKLFTTLGDNVVAVSVRGTFDDCQRLAKEAFADRALREWAGLTSANSINVGRLLPQAFHYFHAWVELDDPEPPVFSVPSGNLGHLTAGLIARAIGLPVARFVAASNRNDAFGRFLRAGEPRPRPSVRTLSNAMDVGDPSNLARIRALHDGDPERIRRLVAATRHDDEATLRGIGDVHRATGYVLDPHSAVGWLGLGEVRRGAALESAGAPGTGVILGTAHPAKFREVVEEATGTVVEPPPRLARWLGREERTVPCDPSLDDLRGILKTG